MPVATPVTLAIADGRVFFGTYDKAWKSRRLARNPNVEIAPSSLRGKTHGPSLAAQARLLRGQDERKARRALARRAPFLQGILVPLAHRLARYRTLHHELLPHAAVKRARPAA